MYLVANGKAIAMIVAGDDAAGEKILEKVQESQGQTTDFSMKVAACAALFSKM